MFTGSIVAIATPMDEQGELDLAAYDALIDRQLDAGTHGIVVAGTTGEASTLQSSEVRTLVDRTLNRVAGRAAVIVGCGSNSTAASMSAAKRAADAGADACLIVTPYYNRPPQKGLLEHFWRVADAAGIPVVLYNVPSRTGCDLMPDTVARLAEHPLIVALKEATGSLSRGEQIVAACGDNLTLLSGDDGTFVDLMALGASGVISVTANLAPKAMATICEFALAGDFDAALALDNTLTALHKALLVQANPIPLKWALTQMGLSKETLRLPLVPLDEAYFAEVASALAAASISMPSLESA